jgi:hypothetical protein
VTGHRQPRQPPPPLPVVAGRITSPDGCEINAAEHCNLSCRSCSHLSPVLRPRLAAADEVHDDLRALATAYRCRFVKLLGGEPLLHKGLGDLVAAARLSGVSDEVHVCTNGRLLDRIDDALWAALDEVEVSVYPGQEPDEATLRRAADAARAGGTRLRLLSNTHFRESYSEVGTDDPGLVRDIYATCKLVHVWRCHTVRDHRFWACPQASFLPSLLGPGAGAPDDGVDLSPTAGLRDRLAALLARTTPLAACRHCLGSAGRRVPHTQIPRREWRSHQDRPSEAMVDRDQLRRLAEDPNADDGCVDDRVQLGGRAAP